MSKTNDMIIYYCLTQNIPMLQYYKNSGVDFNKIRDENGDTLLHLAIFEGKFNTFSALISLGMDLHLTSMFDGTSPLTFAIMYGKQLYVNKLINAGVDINRVDADGWTPLNTVLLMEEHHPQLVQLLLKMSNIDVNLPFNESPPIYIADNLKTAEQIVKHPSFDPTYNLVLLDSKDEPKLENMIRLYHDNIDESILSNYHQAKIFGLKLDFDDCFEFKSFSDHSYNCFSYEGYTNEAGVKEFLKSYNQFYNNVISLSKIPSWAMDTFSSVKTALYFSAGTSDPLLYLNKIRAGELVIISSGWDEHSIFIVIHNNKLYRCNRGDMSDGVHGIEEFTITKPEGLTSQLVKQMLEGSGTPDLLQKDIIDILGLEKTSEIENPTQTAGNCVWTSMEAALEASFIDSFKIAGMEPSIANYYGKQLFTVWEEYDVFMELANVIENKELLVKNEIYDDLLLKALELNHEPNNIFDLQKGGIILSQINEPIFHDAFKVKIGDVVTEFYPNAYYNVSYMGDYTPSSYYDYMKSWALYLNSSKEYSKAKEYYDFLVSCDAFQSKNNLSAIDLKDVVVDASIQALEHILSPNNASVTALNNSTIVALEVAHLELWKNPTLNEHESVIASAFS